MEPSSEYSGLTSIFGPRSRTAQFRNIGAGGDRTRRTECSGSRPDLARDIRDGAARESRRACAARHDHHHISTASGSRPVSRAPARTCAIESRMVSGRMLVRTTTPSAIRPASRGLLDLTYPRRDGPGRGLIRPASGGSLRRGTSAPGKRSGLSTWEVS